MVKRFKSLGKASGRFSLKCSKLSTYLSQWIPAMVLCNRSGISVILLWFCRANRKAIKYKFLSPSLKELSVLFVFSALNVRYLLMSAMMNHHLSGALWCGSCRAKQTAEISNLFGGLDRSFIQQTGAIFNKRLQKVGGSIKHNHQLAERAS